MLHNIAHNPSNKILGSGWTTPPALAGSERPEKWSRRLAEDGVCDMAGSESSKPPGNHIFRPWAEFINLKRLPYPQFEGRLTSLLVEEIVRMAQDRRPHLPPRRPGPIAAVSDESVSCHFSRSHKFGLPG